MDSGASDHFINDLRLFTDYKKQSAILIETTGGVIYGTGHGHVPVETPIGSAFLKNVIHCWDLSENLLSLPALDLSGHCIIIENKTVKVLKGEREVLRGKMAKNRLYYLDLQIPYVPNSTANRAQALKLSNATALAAKLRSSMELAHCRFGHFGVKALASLPKAVDGLVIETKSMRDCEACSLVKSHKLPYAKLKE